MAAPEYVPTSYADKPRQSLPIPPPASWKATRPADLDRGQPYGRTLGRPGPDQGYALALAGRFTDRLKLAENEHATDAVAGSVALAMRRAGMFGRAPVVFDLEHAFGLYGYLDDAPSELVEWRHRAFRGASHDYWEQRAIVDQVPDSTLRLPHADVRRRLGEWRSLVGVGA